MCGCAGVRLCKGQTRDLRQGKLGEQPSLKSNSIMEDLISSIEKLFRRHISDPTTKFKNFFRLGLSNVFDETEFAESLSTFRVLWPKTF